MTTTGNKPTAAAAVAEEEYRESPCTRCPWRVDADLTAFTDADMDRLTRANGTPGREAPLNARTIACHLDQPGTAHPLRLCSGWLAVVGPYHLGVRMMVIAGNLPVAVLARHPGWPALVDSLATLLARRERALGRQTPETTFTCADSARRNTP